VPSAKSCILNTTALLICSVTVALAESPASPDIDPTYQEEGERHIQAELETGYRFSSPDRSSDRANPFGVNRSGATSRFAASLLDTNLKVAADGLFLHPDDYQTELLFDYGGILRAEIESRSLYHNLVRRELFPSFTSTAASGATYNTVPSTDSSKIGIRSQMDRMDTRVRFGHYPAHLSLGYWRFDQTGKTQIIVADFERPNLVNTFYDITRRIDQVTHEGNIGLDANLELLNLAYNFRIRDFSSSAAPVAAPFAISVPSDSRVTSHNIRLYSNMSGGLTTSASYNLTQRENTSNRPDQSVSSQPRDTIQQITGNISYTPASDVTITLKYRHHEIDRETPAQVTSIYTTIPTSSVSPGISSVKDTLILSSLWRLAPQLTIKGDYQAELTSRSNVLLDNAVRGDDRQQIHSANLGIIWRPDRFTRLNATYRYDHNDTPSSYADFSDRHSGNLLFNWNSLKQWGFNLHYRAVADQTERTTATTVAPITSIATPRNSINQSAGGSVWFSPAPRLVVTTSYSCMAIDAQQAMLFSTATASSLTATNYSSIGHLYGVDAVFAATDQIDLSLSLQQVRSRAIFDVPSQSFVISAPTVSTTTGIGSYNRLVSTESSISSRVDWRFNKTFGAALDYRYSAYRADDAQYNGDLHVTTVTLTARW
jgi:hypothetical protein